MDKVLILETLRNYKQFASRNQFAKYLGVDSLKSSEMSKFDA